MTRRRALIVLAMAGLYPAGVAVAAQDERQRLASRGFDLLTEGKPAEALEVLREALRQDPGNPWLYNLLGRACLQSGDLFHARENFATAARIDPGDGYSRMMLDVLSQKPIPAPKADPAAPKHRRAGQVDAKADAELEAFAKTGARPGKRLIIIDPGHGGGDKGVTGVSGLREKDVCLDLAVRLAGRLNEGGAATAVLTRDADYDMPLWARTAVAGIYAADMFVSLHCSAGLNSYSGMEAYTYAAAAADEQARAVSDTENGVVRFERTVGFARPDRSAAGLLGSWKAVRAEAAGRELAGRIRSALAQETPPVAVRVSSAPFSVLAGCPCPAVLAQAGLLSSAGDEQLLGKPDYLEKLAATIARALT